MHSHAYRIQTLEFSSLKLIAMNNALKTKVQQVSEREILKHICVLRRMNKRKQNKRQTHHAKLMTGKEGFKMCKESECYDDFQ